MLKNKLLVAALAAAFAMPVLAEDAPAAPATPSVTSNVTLINDYLYRGLSQTGGNAAIQGGFDYAPSSGLYIGTWGSSISWLSDAGTAANAGLELDTYGGYRFATGPLSYDVGFLRYNYPGTYGAALHGDTNEIYGAVSYSIVTAKLSYSLSDLFGTPDSSGSTYLDLSATYPIGETGYAVGAHYGKQNFASQNGTDNSQFTYSDYKLSATKDLGTGFSLGLAFSKTNAGSAWTDLQGVDTGKSRTLISLTRTL